MTVRVHVAGLALAAATLASPGSSAAQTRRPSSAAWLALLPDSEARRRFILDCTGCHQFDETRAFKAGSSRTESQCAADIERMLGYAGPRSSFPVISTWSERGEAARWLAPRRDGRRPGRVIVTGMFSHTGSGSWRFFDIVMHPHSIAG